VAFTSGAALGTVSSPVQSGTGALSVTNGSTGPTDIWFGSGSGPSSLTQAVGNATYSSSIVVRAASTGRTVAPFLAFYNSAGNMLSSAWGQSVTDGSAGWRVMQVVGLAPPTTAYVGLGGVIYATAAGEVHYFDTASLTATTGSASAVAGPLSTKGNQIVDATGQPVVFRGVHAERGEWSTAGLPSDAFIAGLQRWRANFVRIPLAENLWLNTCPTGTATNDPAYPAAVDRVVQSITSRGMVALLDLHFNVIAPCGTSTQHDMADAQYSLPFWSQLASRYKSNPRVVFDLYNEPHDIPDAVWLSGGPVNEAGTTFVAAGMQQMFDTVRGQGAANLVLVGGQGWASGPASVMVSGTNVANSAHVYTCPNSPPPAPCNFSSPYDPSPLMNGWLNRSQTSPIVVTEFGWPDRSNPIYNQNVISYAEAHGWGWTAFAWATDYAGGDFSLLADIGPNYQPSPSGMPVLSGLAKN
jgi:hypothetical protein